MVKGTIQKSRHLLSSLLNNPTAWYSRSHCTSLRTQYSMTSRAKTTNEIDHLVKRLARSFKDTELSETLREIQSSSTYIRDVQLEKLVKLHDYSFRGKCLSPTRDLYRKYREMRERDGDLASEAAIVDRDIRILEIAIENVKQAKKRDLSRRE